MTAQMKQKWIISFSILLVTILLLCIHLPQDLENQKEVFASTNQTQPVHPLPSNKQSLKKLAAKSSTDKTAASSAESKQSTITAPDKEVTIPETFDKQPKSPKKEETSTAAEKLSNKEQSSGEEGEQVENKKKKVYLTIDDGPSPTTDLLLDILKEYQAQATFFMLEPRMNKFPDSVKRLAEEGHGLALHGVTHDRNLFYQSPETALAEMKQAQTTLANITGITADLVRTPYGSKPNITNSHKKLMIDEGFIIWDWNVDSRDWYFKDSRLVEYTISQIKVLEEKGEDPVILLHDIKYTTNHLPQLLTYLKDNQYEFDILNSSMEPVLLQ